MQFAQKFLGIWRQLFIKKLKQEKREYKKEKKEKKIAKERKVIPDPIDDRKFHE